MGIGSITLGGGQQDEGKEPQSFSRKVFLVSNYVLVAAAASCIFLTLSLRLIPSVAGFLLILVHALTILAAISGCSAWYATHMVATVVGAVIQGAVALLSYTRTADLLQLLHSYVREENGKSIIRMAGALGLLIFALDWLLLTLAFFIRFYPSVSSPRQAAASKEDNKDWPWPFQL